MEGKGCSRRGGSQGKRALEVMDTHDFARGSVKMATMNFPKIGAQGYSLGSLHLNSDEFVWTSADKSRYEPVQASRFYDHCCSISQFHQPRRLLVDGISPLPCLPLCLSPSRSRWLRHCSVRICMRPDIVNIVCCGAIQLEESEVGRCFPRDMGAVRGLLPPPIFHEERRAASAT